MGGTLRVLDLAACRDLARQVPVRFAHCREPRLERGLRTAQGVLGGEQLRHVAHHGDFADEPALGIEQRRGPDRYTYDLTVSLPALGRGRRWLSGADALQNACVIGLRETCGVQLPQRLSDGFLGGIAVKGHRFAIPVGDHRVHVLDDDGLADLREHLLERACALLGLGERRLGATEHIGLDGAHESFLPTNAASRRERFPAQ